jgi:hypothetical protein
MLRNSSSCSVWTALFSSPWKRHSWPLLIEMRRPWTCARPAAAFPDGAHGVDDVLGGEAIAVGQPSLALRTAADFQALLQQLRPRGAMDRAIDAPAAAHRLIGGVDDGVDLELGDVADEDFHAVVHV